jgi:DNA-binding CsgD family transcriptional regulator
LFQEALLVQRFAAELSIAEGQFDAAWDWLNAHDRWLSAAGAVQGVADGAIAWAGYFLATGDLAEAARFAQRALAAASTPRQPLAIARAHRRCAEVATRQGNAHAANEHLDEALALSLACNAPYERALALIVRAEACAGNGLDARESTVEATAICTGLRADPALERIAAIACHLAPDPLPLGLTQREIEVLRLVAHGLTDAAVANELFISPRTVGQHLRSIYGKLDVSTRSAATRIAVEHGIT